MGTRLQEFWILWVACYMELARGSAAGLVKILWGSEGSEWPGRVRQLKWQVGDAGVE